MEFILFGTTLLPERQVADFPRFLLEVTVEVPNGSVSSTEVWRVWVARNAESPGDEGARIRIIGDHVCSRHLGHHD